MYSTRCSVALKGIICQPFISFLANKDGNFLEFSLVAVKTSDTTIACLEYFLVSLIVTAQRRFLAWINISLDASHLRSIKHLNITEAEMKPGQPFLLHIIQPMLQAIELSQVHAHSSLQSLTPPQFPCLEYVISVHTT